MEQAGNLDINSDYACLLTTTAEAPTHLQIYTST